MDVRFTKIEGLLTRAVDLLGALALKQRQKLSRRAAFDLEDGLFAVLEELNDLREKAPGSTPGGRRNAESRKRDSDGTA